MAEHDVGIRVETPLAVLSGDVSFVVAGDGEHLGELLVSKGGVEWRAKYAKKGRHLTWEQLHALMQEEGKLVP